MVGTSVSLMLMMVAFVTDVGGGWWWRWGVCNGCWDDGVAGWCYYFGLKIWVLLLAKTKKKLDPFKEIQRNGGDESLPQINHDF